MFSFGLVVAIARRANASEDAKAVGTAATIGDGNGTATSAIASVTPSECSDGGEEQELGVHWISADDWGKGFVHMAVPQIPLTTLNSVIAVCKLSDDLFPHTDERHKATPRRVRILRFCNATRRRLAVCTC